MPLEEPAVPEAPVVPEAPAVLEAHAAKEGRRVTFDPNLPNDDEERANRARLHSRRTRAERQEYHDFMRFRDRIQLFVKNVGNRFRQILVIKALIFLFSYDQEEVYFVARQGPAMEGGMEVGMEPVRKRWATRVFIFVAITYTFLAVVTIGHFKVCLPLVDMRCLLVWFGFTPRDGWFPQSSPVPAYAQFPGFSELLFYRLLHHQGQNFSNDDQHHKRFSLQDHNSCNNFEHHESFK
ncbi:uncharacterized protein LOC125941130 [Dermacentor silvarum]|uniref:uncharacterized protein LOC125941130 n=1 Tax=Dermacentor silvarum TaxID=543639 RepID=UPI002100B188|nr:uncharacterized protein LOC125941130 [Dermacentor silvarum]